MRAGRCRGPATGTLPRPADPATSPSGRSARRIPWRTLLAAAGGLVLVLAFPGYDLPGLAVLGPAALALAVRGRRSRSGAWLGLVFGLAFFVPLLSWTGIVRRSVPVAGPRRLRGVHLALLGGATALTSRLPLWPLWTAALWVADEALRGRFVLRRLPVGAARLQPDLRARCSSLAAYGGVPLVTFAVALTGALLAAAASRCTAPGSPRTTPGSGVRPSGRPR